MSLIYHYPVDLTGRNPTNLVSGEGHLLVDHEGAPYSLFSLDHGGFYTEGLKVFDKNYVELKPGIDYIATYTYENATFRTGREVCGVILFLNPNITGMTYVNAQMVGGDYAFDLNAVEHTLQWLRDNPDTVPTWAGIVGEERKWLPGELDDELWEKAGYQTMNQKLEELVTALMMGDQVALSELRSNINALHQDYLNGNDSSLQTHIGDTNNPHALTKAQLLLNLVQNYPVSTVEQAMSGLSDEAYMTPALMRAALEKLALEPLQQHIDDESNPHGITAADAGVYTNSEFQALLDQRLERDATAVNSRNMSDPSDNGFKLLNVWERISRRRWNDITDYGPGPTAIVGGNLAAGYFGELPLNGVNRYVQSVEGQYSITLQPGVYSAFLVGGGGGGAGNMSSTVPTTAAGGGSGYADKVSFTVNQGDIVQIQVGKGGRHNTDGTASTILVNGSVVATAAGGIAGKYIAAGMRSQGGNGGSGGGSAGGYYGTGGTQSWSTPGDGGTNGTNGGANGAVSGGIQGGPGGTGEGSGYYDTVLQSVDPLELHGFVIGQHGRGGIKRGGGVYSSSDVQRGSCGGGGGGVGREKAPRHDFAAAGYGAGGTTSSNAVLSAGHDGLVSILPISVPPPALENISGNDLAQMLNMTAGVPINPETGWLKFVFNGRVLYVAKKHMRSNITWNQLNTANAVRGNRTLTIDGRVYTPRLIRGSDRDPQTVVNGGTAGAADTTPSNTAIEWNALMYQVTTASPVVNNWASFSPADIEVGYGSTVYGTICMESAGVNGNSTIRRGSRSIDWIQQWSKESGSNWRPVLEYAITTWRFQNPENGEIITTDSFTTALNTSNPYSDLNAIQESVFWSYDDPSATLSYTEKSQSLVGLVSNETRDTYVLEVRLDAAKDGIGVGHVGVILARAIDSDGKRHILTAMRGMSGEAPLVVEVNRDGFDSREYMVAAVRSGLTWGDGSVAVSPLAEQSVVAGWENVTGGVKLKVERNGDSITIETTQWGDDVYFEAAKTTIDLNSHPSLAVFKGPQNYGFACMNQKGASWFTLESPTETLSYTQLVQNLRSGLDASNFTSGVFSPARLGVGTANDATVLRGDGTWTRVDTLINEYYEDTSTRVYFIGQQGTDEDAINFISVTFSSINDYPIGTIVLYRTSVAVWHISGNGGAAYTPILLRAAVRQSTGWTSM